MRAKSYLMCLLFTVGCSSALEPADSSEDKAGPAGKADEFTTRADRAATFEEFRDSLYCEPNDGPCIVEGDVPIWGEERLERYYRESLELESALTVMQLDAVDSVWSRTERFDLTYCVSDTFGERKQEVVDALAQAVAEWEEIAHVDFEYLPEQDARCHWRNAQVKFDVRPTDDKWATYIARAFFPHQPRAERQILVNLPSHDDMLEDKGESEGYSLLGVMRHELGHVLGFRHEHIRDEASAWFCREDSDYRPITQYDAASVMHYPHCNGDNDWKLELTETDAKGAAFFYPDFERYQAARCEEELDEEGFVLDSCEPVVHEMLELANTASLEVLDEWVGLDRRAAEEMIERRERTPFNTLQELRDIRYFADFGLRRMYDYLYVDGRCPSEIDEDGQIDARCRPVVHAILALANSASLEELDGDVSLDRRAAANIVAIRQSRPFASLDELWAVDYVKTRALSKMYSYLYQ